MSPPTPYCPGVFSDAACSGRGVCIGDHACQCVEPFLGESDFAFSTPSCAVHAPTVQALYSLLVLTCAFEAPVAIYALFCRLSGSEKLDRAHFAIRCANLSSLAAVGVLRATRPREVIGSEVAVTILYAAAWLFAVLNVVTFGTKVLNLNAVFLSNASISRGLELFRRALLPYCFPIIILSSPLFIAMIFINDYDSRYKVIQVHYFGMTLTIFVLSIGAIYYTFNPFIAALQQSLDARSAHVISNADSNTVAIKHVLVKFKRAKNLWLGHVIFMMIVGIPFGAIPVLNNAGSSYLIPLQMISWELLQPFFTVNLLRESEVRDAPFFVRSLYALAIAGTLSSSIIEEKQSEKKLSGNGSDGQAMSHGSLAVFSSSAVEPSSPVTRAL